MNEDYTGEKLCIFIGEDDKYEGHALYGLLLGIALKNGLSGGLSFVVEKVLALMVKFTQ